MKEYQKRDWLYEEYVVKKRTTTEMADSQGVSSSTIERWLHRYKITRPRRCFKHPPLDIHEIKRLYDQGYSLRDIGAKFGVSSYPIRAIMKKHGISRRPSQVQNHTTIQPKTLEILKGILLGDGSLYFEKDARSAIFSLGNQYYEYVEYTAEKLAAGGIGHRKIHKIYDSRFDATIYSVQSRAYPELIPLRQEFYPDGYKRIPKSLVLTPDVLREWFICDGTVDRARNDPSKIVAIRICTDAFPSSDVDWAVDRLGDLGIEATRQPARNRIGIRRKSVSRFFKFIGSCPVKCYGYKWPRFLHHD